MTDYSRTSPAPNDIRSKFPLNAGTLNDDATYKRLLPAALSGTFTAATTNSSSSISTPPPPAVSPILSTAFGAGGGGTAAAYNASRHIPASQSFSQHLGEHSSVARGNGVVGTVNLGQHINNNNNNNNSSYTSRAAATTSASSSYHPQPDPSRSFRSNLATASSAVMTTGLSSNSAGGGVPMTSVAARAEALEIELDKVKRRNQQLESDMVEIRREQHNGRLEREQDRLHLAQRHLQDMEMEKDKVRLAREEDERRAAEAVQAERRRTEQALERIRAQEEAMNKLNQTLMEKDREIESLFRKASDMEIKMSDQMREMQTIVRTYEAKMGTMQQSMEGRAKEVDHAQQHLRDAEARQEELRKHIRGVEEAKADLQAQNGKLEVQLHAARQDYRMQQAELLDERERRTREQNSLVAAAEKQRDDMRSQDTAIAELREDLRRRAKDAHDLELELSNARATTGEMRSEVERLTRESQRWEKRAADNGAEYHTQVLKNNDLEASMAQMRSDLREADIRATEASELISKLREHIAELKDEMHKATALADSYKSQLSAVDFAHQQLRSQSAMIERCENDLEAREKKIRELGAALHAAEEKGTMASELLSHVKQLETELNSKNEYTQSVLNRLETVKATLDATRTEVAERDGSVERLNLRLSEYEAALKERDGRIYTLDREVATKHIAEANCAQLEAQVGQRTHELERSFEEIALLKHRVMDLDQHLARAQDLEVTIKRLDTERVVLHSEKEQLLAAMQERDNECKTLRIVVEERSVEIESKNVDLSRMRRELEVTRRLEAERAALKDRVAQLDAHLTESTTQLRQVQTLNESMHAETAQMSQQLTQQKIATHEAREKLESTKRALDEAQIENGRLAVTIENAKRDVDRAAAEKSSVNNRLQQYGAQIDALRAQLAETVQKESKASTAADALQAELRQKHAVAEDYLRQVTELRRQLSQREISIASLEEDSSVLRATCAKISVMEGKVAALERLVQDRDAELDRVTLHSRQQQDQLATMSSELAQAERAVKAAQDVRRKAATLQDDLDNAADDISKLRQQLAEKERAITGLQSQVRDNGSDIEMMRKREKSDAAQLEALEAEVRRLKIAEGEMQGLTQVLRGKDGDIDALRGHTAQQQQKIGELEEIVQRNQRVIHENAVLEARMKSRDETVHALEKEMNTRALQNRELTAEVEHLTQSLRKLQSTADAIKESRDVMERENKGLRDRIEFLMRNSREDTVKASEEVEAARAATHDARAELAAAREKASATQLLAQRQSEQLAAAETRFDALAKELAAAKSELAATRLSHDERTATLQRLTDGLGAEKARSRNASDAVSTLQQSANEHALRSAEERAEAQKLIDRLERSVEELKSQLSQRNAAISERGRAQAQTEERLRECENELRRAVEQKSVLEHRARSLEDDLAVLQRSAEMAAARRKAAELSLHDADGKLAEQGLRIREMDRMTAFERQTNADREAALKREADRLALAERSLRERTFSLEGQLDESRLAGSPVARSGPRQRPY